MKQAETGTLLVEMIWKMGITEQTDYWSKCVGSPTGNGPEDAFGWYTAKHSKSMTAGVWILPRMPFSMASGFFY